MTACDSTIPTNFFTPRYYVYTGQMQAGGGGGKNEKRSIRGTGIETMQQLGKKRSCVATEESQENICCIFSTCGQ